MRCAILSCVTMALSVTLACAHDMNALGLGNLDGTISNDVDGNLLNEEGRRHRLLQHRKKSSLDKYDKDLRSSRQLELDNQLKDSLANALTSDLPLNKRKKKKLGLSGSNNSDGQSNSGKKKILGLSDSNNSDGQSNSVKRKEKKKNKKEKTRSNTDESGLTQREKKALLKNENNNISSNELESIAEVEGSEQAASTFANSNSGVEINHVNYDEECKCEQSDPVTEEEDADVSSSSKIYMGANNKPINKNKKKKLERHGDIEVRRALEKETESKSGKSEKGTSSGKSGKGAKSAKSDKGAKSGKEVCFCSYVAVRPDLEMSLFGISSMDLIETTFYENQTAAYIEEFYNDADSTPDDLQGILFGVMARVTVSHLTFPVATPELISDKKKGRGKRNLQGDTEGNPLIVTFTIELRYNSSNSDLNPNILMAVPFETSIFRDYYMNEFLKSDGQFEDLTRTSAVEFPDTLSPTKQPSTKPTSKPTSSPTVPPGAPSKLPTKQPTPKPSRNPTSSPTRDPTPKPSRSPTNQPTGKPSPIPTKPPTKQPSKAPTFKPTRSPTAEPTVPPGTPSKSPTSAPTTSPTSSTSPSVSPTPECDSNKYITVPNFVKPILPDDISSDDAFGYSVEVDGGHMVVGAPGIGKVYIYEFSDDEWSVLSTFSVDQDTDGLGTAVAISSNIIAIGSPFANNNTGEVYILEIVGDGEIVQHNTLSGEAAGNQFGLAVDISETVIAVGSPFHNGTGSVYVYKPSDENENIWETWQKISPTVDAGDFGFSVAILIDTIVVGSPYRSKPTTEGGSVLVFRRVIEQDGMAWIPFQQLSPPGINYFGDNYGFSVDIFIDTQTVESTIVVGARNAADSGEAYVYTDPTLDTFELQQTLSTFEPSSSGGFGYAVSVDKNNILVGSPYGSSGSAYFFYRENDEWKGRVILVPENTANEAFFGAAVSLSEKHLMVGAFLSITAGEGSGEVYQYKLKDVCDTSTPHPTFEPSQTPSLTPTTTPTETPSNAPTPQCDNKIPVPNFIMPIMPDEVSSEFILGYSLEVHENFAVIGAPNYLGFGEGAGDGQAYIYEYSGGDWNLFHTFSTGTDSGGVGYSVSISANPTHIIAISSPYANNSTGAVYIIEILDNGAIMQRNTLVGESQGDFFGAAVDVSENIVVVGSPFHNGTGAVYVYAPSPDDSNEWEFNSKISPTVDAGDYGFSVSIFIDTIVVGSPYRTKPVTEGGAVFIYRREGTTWIPFQQLSPPGIDSSGDQFGCDVDIFIDSETVESTIVVGARNAADFTGEAYVYTDPTLDTFELQQTLNPVAPGVSSGFGYAVSVDKNNILVGSPYGSSGSSYFFYRENGEWEGSLMPLPNGTESENSFFGAAVSVSENQLLIGAALSDVAGENSGAVYQFKLKKVCDPL